MPEELIAQPPNGLTTPQTPNLLAVIANAAANPAVDVQKMQALLEMQRSIEADRREQEFNADFVALQSELPIVTKSSYNPGTKSKYCKIEDLQRVVRPLYTYRGFAFSFAARPHPTDPKQVIICATLIHRGGHSRVYELPIHWSKSGAMNDTQADGSTYSYGERYLIIKALGIVMENEDKDGGNPSPISDDQQIKLETLLTALDDAYAQKDPKHVKGSAKRRFLAWIGADTLSDVREADYSRSLAQINARIKEARA